MRIFLDSSVLLAASGSSRGASRFILVSASAHDWMLVSSPYCVAEVLRNIGKLGPESTKEWESIVQPGFDLVADTWAIDLPLTIPSKDRPVLMSALAEECEVLLTLDQADFGAFFDKGVYGMDVMTPGRFLGKYRDSPV